MKFLRLVTLVLFFSILFFGKIFFANAFAVSPLGYTLTIDPGKSQTATILIENNEWVKHSYEISVESLRVSEEGRRLYLKNFDPAESWVAVSPATFSLARGAQKTVSFKISVPRDQQPGSRSLVLMVASLPPNGQTIGLTAKSAVPIFLVVSGVVKENIIINRWQASKSLIFDHKIPLAIEVYNNGTINTEVHGRVTVIDSGGRKILDENVRFGSSIFPDSARRLAPVISLADWTWPGKYRVRLDIQYGVSKTAASAETEIWYLPAPLIFIVFCSLIIVMGIVLWLRKK